MLSKQSYSILRSTVKTFLFIFFADDLRWEFFARVEDNNIAIINVTESQKKKIDSRGIILLKIYIFIELIHNIMRI